MKTLAQKVDWLFDVHRTPQGKQFTYGQVQRATGNRITASYVWKLRTGAMGNPGLSALEALADFFQVPLDYFSRGGEYLEDTIRLAHTMPNSGGSRQDALRRLAARADSLSDEHLRAVVELAEYLSAHEQPASTA
jgi:transcriptional regulator with XRE-family HTH domain